MGWILSKFRKKRSTFEELEKIEVELNSLGKLKTETLVWQKKVLGHLVTYSILLYLISALIVYFKFLPSARRRQDQALLLLPFLVTPLLIYLLRRVLTWWYHRKVAKGDGKLTALREKKSKILEEVMEKETYKVAKQILDKFAPGRSQSALSPPRPVGPAPNRSGGGGGGGPPGSGMELRRRPGPPTATLIPPSGSASAATSPGAAGPPNRPGGGVLATPASRVPGGPPLQPGTGTPPAIAAPGGPLGRGGAPGPPLPRPVLPRERGYLDKFVEYLVGDGPTNRFALVCRQCQSHNGMALREEFEYIAYRCCYCFYWNPARKQRPVAPRLPEASTFATSGDSSSSEDSRHSSVANSRRGSLSETAGDNSQVDKEEPKKLSEADLEHTDPVPAEDDNLIPNEEVVPVLGIDNSDTNVNANNLNIEAGSKELVSTPSDNVGADWGLVVNKEETKKVEIEQGEGAPLTLGGKDEDNDPPIVGGEAMEIVDAADEDGMEVKPKLNEEN